MTLNLEDNLLKSKQSDVVQPPDYMKFDIAYCQCALGRYMKMYQMWMDVFPTQEVQIRKKESILRKLEEEIIDIGADQEIIFNGLRNMTKYVTDANKPQFLTDVKQSILPMITRMENEDPNSRPVLPIRVKIRLSMLQLLRRYSIENVFNRLSTPSAPKIDDDGEVMEVLVSPANVPPKTFSLSPQKQPSLLKPRSELTVDEPTDTTSNECGIRKSRLNLLQALKNAKSQSTMQSKRLIEMDVKPKLLISSSPIQLTSSSSSSVGELEESDPNEPTTYTKEAFLRLFGLYTHSYMTFLRQRRSERRKRNITSTAKCDYRYDGNYGLFEKSTKPKRAYLHSPPTTRLKRFKQQVKRAKSGSRSPTYR